VSDLAAIDAVVVCEIDLLAPCSVTDEGDGRAGDPFVPGQRFHDIVGDSVGAHTGTAAVGFGDNGLTSFFDNTLQDAAGCGATDRDIGESRRRQREPPGKRQVILKDLGNGGTLAATDPREGHIQRIAFADGDGRRLSTNDGRGAKGKDQGDKDRGSHGWHGDKSAACFQRCPITGSRGVGSQGVDRDRHFTSSRECLLNLGFGETPLYL